MKTMKEVMMDVIGMIPAVHAEARARLQKLHDEFTPDQHQAIRRTVSTVLHTIPGESPWKIAAIALWDAGDMIATSIEDQKLPQGVTSEPNEKVDPDVADLHENF